MRKFQLSLVLITAAGWWLVVSCENTTGAQRVEFETFVAGTGGAEPFENDPPTGDGPWTVRLDEAWAALGPVYLFEGEPLLTQLYHRLVLPRAFAHPGHYQEGAAVGEALDQRVVDLLNPEPTLLGPMNAVTGECHSAQVGLGTASPEVSGAELLGGHALLVRGQAARGDELVTFEAHLDEDLYVEGIAFEHEINTAPGHLLVEVDLQRWFHRVDFGTAIPGASSEEPATFTEETQAHNALSRGVDNTLTYRFSWVPESEGE